MIFIKKPKVTYMYIYIFIKKPKVTYIYIYVSFIKYFSSTRIFYIENIKAD
jgi:hypothetical protein